MKDSKTDPSDNNDESEKSKIQEKSKKISKEKTIEEDDRILSHYLKKTWRITNQDFKQGWQNFIYNIRHPKKAIIKLFNSKTFIVNALAIIVGLVGALSAWAFEWLSEGTDYIFLERLFPLMYNNFQSWRFLAIIITPVIAAVITAPIIWRYNPESKGSGIPYVLEAIALRDGYMPKRTPFVKMFTSAICLGGGLSVGREGPITQIGAGFSSGIAHLVGLHGRNMRIVVISGLSAAIAATFNSPIGGALFGIEILLVSLVADEIVPVVIASLTSSTFSALIDILKLSPNSSGIPEPSFKVDVLRDLTWDSFIYDLHWFIILGILAGLVGVIYAKFFHLVRAIFNRIRVQGLFLPIIGAALTGIFAIASPRNQNGIPLIYGASYHSITDILNNDTTTLSEQNPLNSIISFLIVLLLLKIIVTSLSVGSGNPGGIFAPALFIGACTGSAFANTINNSNAIEVNISVFALAGLASVFAGATRAPLTMIFMGAEMTGNITLMIPLMLTCSISYLICRGFLKESIYTQPLVDKGLRIVIGGQIVKLSTTRVEEIMTKEVISVDRNATMEEASKLVKDYSVFGLPIVDESQSLYGMISVSDIKIAQMENKLNEPVTNYAKTSIITLNKDQFVNEALDILNRAGIKRAPVINNNTEKKLLGILSTTDIMRAFEIEKLKDV
ncbi:MAG: chloride channel protein [Asgard group archaeon]|nr:chloride channel protein [Asgard group archaeon]